MKLYDVPRNTRIKVDGQELLFHRIDGMYSLCTDEKGFMYHPAAWADVEVLETRRDHQDNR